MKDTSKEVLSSLEENEISFSDISYPISNVPVEVNPDDCNDRSDAESVEAIRPVAVIKNGSMTVAITNDISDRMLTRILKEVSNA